MGERLRVEVTSALGSILGLLVPLASGFRDGSNVKNRAGVGFRV